MRIYKNLFCFFILSVIAFIGFACTEPDYQDFKEKNNYALLPFEHSGDGTEEVKSFPITINSYDANNSPILFNMNEGKPQAYFLEGEAGNVLCIPFYYKNDATPMVASYVKLKDVVAKWKEEENKNGQLVKIKEDASISTFMYAYGNMTYRKGKYNNTALTKDQLSFFVYSLKNSNAKDLSTVLNSHLTSHKPDYKGKITTITNFTASLEITSIDGFKQPNGKLIATTLNEVKEETDDKTTSFKVVLRNSSKSPVYLIDPIDVNNYPNASILALFAKEGTNYIPKWVHVLNSKDQFPKRTNDDTPVEVTPAAESSIVIQLSTPLYKKIGTTHALFLSGFEDVLPKN